LQDIDRIDVDIETPSHKCGRHAQDPCETNFKCQYFTIDSIKGGMRGILMGFSISNV
jgi:hypothetical protein